MKKQIYAGDSQKPLYPKGSIMNKVWATDGKGLYWCGHHYHRTPQQLFLECTTTIADLQVNHPGLFASEQEQSK